MVDDLLLLVAKLWGYVSNLSTSGEITYSIVMQNFSTAVAIGTPKANGSAPQIFSLANTTKSSFDYWIETSGTALRYFVIGQ